jgi:septal ring factor EnvC (AmiA/AmiB activator)
MLAVKKVKNMMKTVIPFLVLTLFLLTATGPLFAQKNSNALKKKRKKLEKEIAYTNKLLKETRKNKKNTLYELQLLQNKITQRNELITTLKKEIAALDKKIANTRTDINLMNKNLEQLKKEYARIISFLSRHNNDLDKLVFLFSSEDMNQAYQRLRYMDEMLHYIHKQADTIQHYEKLQEKELKDLNLQKAEKKKLLVKENEQLQRIESNIAEKDKVKNSLIKKESQLRARLRQKQKDAKKLNKQIENIIVKETKVKKTPSGKTGYALSKEDQKLSTEFSKNKGRLPWPVDNGFISERFGKHPHPVLKHVEINNNGINIATSSGSNAKAVFEGKVVSVAQISNTNNAVIVKHGNWFTVYSNLDNVYVSRGDQVKTGEVLGKIPPNLKGRTELHFEVWYGKKKQNPAYWIRKK